MGCQTKACKDWHAQLEEISAYEPAHLSCYQLTIEPGTIFHTRHKKGAVLTADADEVADLYLHTEQQLQERAYMPMRCRTMPKMDMPHDII